MVIDLPTFHRLVEANRQEEQFAQCGDDSIRVDRPAVNDGDESFDGFWIIKDGKLCLSLHGEAIKKVAWIILDDIHVAKVNLAFFEKLKKQFPDRVEEIEASAVLRRQAIAVSREQLRNLFSEHPRNTITDGDPRFEEILGLKA